MNNIITINDVIAICQIINLASSRGAFRADELTQIGAVYDRLAQMVDSVQHQQESTTDSLPSKTTGE